MAKAPPFGKKTPEKGAKTDKKLPPWLAGKASKPCKKCGKTPCKC